MASKPTPSGPTPEVDSAPIYLGQRAQTVAYLVLELARASVVAASAISVLRGYPVTPELVALVSAVLLQRRMMRRR